MKISFEGIGREVVTAKVSGQLSKGNLCWFVSDKTVAPPSSGGKFSGKVLEIFADGTASVQVRGYIEVPYTDTTPLGTLDRQRFVCSNAGAIHRDNSGTEYLVISQNQNKKIVGILL